jgi:c-di-GMP-binding flagellar brake protein YcgR
MTGGIRSSHGVSLDISEGGLGALVESKLAVGDTVGIELNLQEYDLNAVGIVRYTSSLRSGFEFLGLTEEERQHIASLVKSLTRSESERIRPFVSLRVRPVTHLFPHALT